MRTTTIAILALLLAVLRIDGYAQSQHLACDGASGAVYATPGGVARPLSSMTIETWIRMNAIPATEGEPIWQENLNSMYPVFGFSVGIGGYIDMSYHHSGQWDTYTSTSPLIAGRWHHVAATFSYPGTVEFFVDGESAGSFPVLNDPGLSPGVVSCGLGCEQAMTASNPYLNGQLDEFRIWSTNRTQSQIQADLNFAVSTHPDLLLHLSFEGSLSSTSGGFASTAVGVPVFPMGATPDSVSPYQGSGEDFVLETSTNSIPTPWDAFHAANPGDLLTVHFRSPMGSYDNIPPLLFAQLFPHGSPPFQPVDYPEVQLDFAPNVYYPILTLYSGLASPFGPAVLPAGGMTFAYVIPGGLSGLSLMLQAFSVSPSNNMNNNWFTCTDGHEIYFQ